MTVRIRYAGTELCPEGVVEIVHEANGYVVEDDNTLVLKQQWWDEDDERNRRRTVGTVHPDRWQSVVNVDDQISA